MRKKPEMPESRSSPWAAAPPGWCPALLWGHGLRVSPGWGQVPRANGMRAQEAPLGSAGTALRLAATSLRNFFLQGLPKLAAVLAGQTGFFLCLSPQQPSRGLS